MSLDDKIDADGIDMSNYVPAIAEAYKFDGVQYGMPKDINAFGLFYNKDLFTAGRRGHSPMRPGPGRTSSTRPRSSPTHQGRLRHRRAGGRRTAWYLTIPQAGGSVISEDGKTSGYDKPETIRPASSSGSTWSTRRPRPTCSS